MKADVISVGTELLLGQITDTNATYISQRLADIGVDVYFRTTVGDNQSRLCGALRQALGRADAVVITGGLGPTADDLTRESVAEAAGRALVRDARAARRLEEWFQRRNYPLAQINYKQATVPEGGRLIDNSCGTAPGLLVEHEGVVIFAVPGPPVEMRAMLDGDVIPYLRAAAGGQQLFSRRLRMCDIGESTVQERLADLFESQTDPTIAPYASPGEVVVRLSTKAADPQAAEAKLSPVEAEIRRRLGAHVYGVDEDSMAAAAGRALRERGLTLAVAESCTGGLITSRITDVPGASDYLLAGIVAYANQAKQDALGVAQELLEAHGAVSEPVARAMAEGGPRPPPGGLRTGDDGHCRPRRRNRDEAGRAGLHRVRRAAGDDLRRAPHAGRPRAVQDARLAGGAEHAAQADPGPGEQKGRCTGHRPTGVARQ